MNQFASNRVGIVKNVGSNAIRIELPDTNQEIDWPVAEENLSSFNPGESVSLHLQKVMTDISPPRKTQRETGQTQEEQEDNARKRQLLEQLLN